VALLAAPLLSLAMLGGTASAAVARTTSVKAGPVVTRPAALPSWSGCNQRICIRVQATNKRAMGGTIRAIVTAWARFGGDSFDGHYQLLLPVPRFDTNSGPNKIWTHSPAWSKNEFLRPKGQWCVVGWRYNGGHNYSIIGRPCVTVNQ
jgi:hypothetical protein